ncbi:hypothetical protein FRB95_013066 [Tulasnella sp. JGI-2019a]|nr:hypothetical protein FRB95_013066 [Tulasnella sp. JGI-2019a]
MGECLSSSSSPSSSGLTPSLFSLDSSSSSSGTTTPEQHNRSAAPSPSGTPGRSPTPNPQQLAPAPAPPQLIAIPPALRHLPCADAEDLMQQMDAYHNTIRDRLVEEHRQLLFQWHAEHVPPASNASTPAANASPAPFLPSPSPSVALPCSPSPPCSLSPTPAHTPTPEPPACRSHSHSVVPEVPPRLIPAPQPQLESYQRVTCSGRINQPPSTNCSAVLPEQQGSCTRHIDKEDSEDEGGDSSGDEDEYEEGVSHTAEYAYSTMVDAIQDFYAGGYLGMMEAYQLTFEHAHKVATHGTELRTYAEAMQYPHADQ